ncbi:hypothetical protein, partial [Solibacillus sp.]|uniref:hypothetical protein n=1 Tax=Solibacillus sp. TaxID=1909654 RepID=UPI0033148373
MIIIFLLFYLLTPILMTPFIIFLLIYSEKYTKIYSFLLSFNIGIIGYYFVPPINFDLFRHFLKLDELSTLSLIDALQYNQSPLVIENLWFYAIALIGDYGLLPLGAITLSYYFVIVITVEYCKSRKISKIYILTAILLILSWYQLINPMSGVRFSTALSLSAYGIYKIY